MKCVNCGTQVAAGAKFCSQCGAACAPDIATRARAPRKPRPLVWLLGGALLFACAACLLVEMFVVITANPIETEMEMMTAIAQAATDMPAGLGTRELATEATAIAQDVSVPTAATYESPFGLTPDAASAPTTPIPVFTVSPSNTLAPPTPMQVPTLSPTETRQAESAAFAPGEIILQDNFDASPAQALFGSQHMTFVSENGQGVLTGNSPKVILPAMYNDMTIRDFEAAFDLIPPPVPSDSSYGLLFRSDDARGGLAQYYLVVLNGKTNRVGFLCFKNGTFVRQDTENFMPGLWQTDKPNRVRVQAAENLFNVFLNDALIYSAQDALLPDAGYIGLAMFTSETVPDTVRFDNLTITATDVTRIAIAPTATNILPTATRPMATATPTKTRVPPTATRAPEASQPCPNPPRSLYWSDDFSNPNSGWMNFQGADHSHFYKAGEWHFAVTAKNKTGTVWIQLRERTLHQAITVRAWRLGEPPLNSYGVIFGGQDDENYYAFRISDSGSFRLSHVIQNEWHDLIPWTKTTAIHQGGVNELAVLLDGAQIYACVNGQLVGATSDTALQPGRVGMIAGAYDEPTHIHFDDFAVWNLLGPVTVNQNASAPGAPAQPAVNAPPGIYVSALRTNPANPKRNQDVSCVATFLNTTGAAQNMDWLVIVYQPDAKKSFGETAAQRITVPPGVSEFTSASNWAVHGPGGCINLYGIPHMQNPNSSRTPLNQRTAAPRELIFRSVRDKIAFVQYSTHNPATLPTARGTYALLLYLPRATHLQIGKLGAFNFPRGDYVYVGSARGAGGLRARVMRHWRGGARWHWHIDYLRAVARPVRVWYSTDAQANECVWAARLQAAAARVIAPRFGASDCECATHLYFLERASLTRAQRRLATLGALK